MIAPFIALLFVIACVVGIIITAVYHSNEKISRGTAQGIYIACGIVGIISFVAMGVTSQH